MFCRGFFSKLWLLTYFLEQNKIVEMDLTTIRLYQIF